MNKTLYFGTYTDYPPASGERAESIYLGQLDDASGEITQSEGFNGGRNASFLALHPTRPLLYAVNEGGEGAASALERQPDGSLRLLNHQQVQGADPCYLTVSPSGRWLVTASYSSGTLSVLPIEADGRLGPLAGRTQHEGTGPHPNQDKAHAHCAIFDPTGRWLLAADLGMDRVWVYRLDEASGQLEANDPPGLSMAPGAGPRHVVFDPTGRFVYISNELDSTVTVAAWDAEAGQLTALQTLSTLPEGFQGENAVADIHLAPSGEFLYVSNRGHNSLAVYRMEGQGERLTMRGTHPCGGNWPRNFAIDPSGRWLLVANQKSQNVAVLAIQPDGALAETGRSLDVPAPVFVMVA